MADLDRASRGEVTKAASAPEPKIGVFLGSARMIGPGTNSYAAILVDNCQ
jgi:hypothetical protein